MQRLLARAALLALVSAFGPSCHSDSTPTAPTGPLKLLFIGNSLTYTNDLPGMVTGLAKASGLDVSADVVAFPGFALIDHWNEGTALAKLRSQHYDFVILQQGPTSLLINRDSLIMWTQMWEPEIRAAGARPALFAVWPDSSRFFAFADVAESYREAAQAVQGVFLPVGDTWLATWARVPNAALYGSDNFHPNVAGSYAAAVVIVARLCNRSATSLSASFTPHGETVGDWTAELGAAIRAAAAVVLARSKNIVPAR